MAFLDENGVAQLWAAVKDRLAGAFDSVEFNVAEQAANLMSGDSIATAFGKLAKNYSSILTSMSDLNTSLGNRITEVNTNLTNQINTKLNKSDVLANYTTTTTGKALDASLGPAIKSKMDQVNTLANKDEAQHTWQPWTPKLYDLNTELRTLESGHYIQIGGLIFAYANMLNPDLSGINTMLQIKNVPINFIIGGSIYLAGLQGAGGDRTVQMSGPNTIYYRPNITSNDITNPKQPSWVSFWCFGL